jgi:hypothetical protein
MSVVLATQEDQGDCGSKQPRQIVHKTPILKIPHTKQGCWSGSSGSVPA